MMNKYKALGATLAILLASSSVNAAPQGGYIGIGAGSSSVEHAVTGEDLDDTSMKVFLGYQFNKNFAAELGYSSFGDVVDDAELSGVEVSALGILPVNPKFSVFGRVGFWSWDVSVPFAGYYYPILDGTDVFYGGGLEFNPTSRIRLRLEANKYEVEETEGTTVNGTFAYRF